MDNHPYDPQCPDCVPALIDPETGEIIPKSDPIMVTIMKVWNAASVEDRQAFMNITWANSQEPVDRERMSLLMRRIQKAVDVYTKNLS
jgi:hypothetical protein